MWISLQLPDIVCILLKNYIHIVFIYLIYYWTESQIDALYTILFIIIVFQLLANLYYYYY